MDLPVCFQMENANAKGPVLSLCCHYVSLGKLYLLSGPVFLCKTMGWTTHSLNTLPAQRCLVGIWKLTARRIPLIGEITDCSLLGLGDNFPRKKPLRICRAIEMCPEKGYRLTYSPKLSQMAQETKPQTRSLSLTRDLLPLRAGSGHRGTSSTGLNGIKRETGGCALHIFSPGWEEKSHLSRASVSQCLC